MQFPIRSMFDFLESCFRLQFTQVVYYFSENDIERTLVNVPGIYLYCTGIKRWFG